MNSKITLGQYYNSNSWLHRLDPRVKIIGLILLMVSVFIVNSIYYVAGMFVFVNIIVISSKIPYTKFLASIKSLSYVLIIMFIFQVLFRRTGNILYTYNVYFSVLNIICISILTIVSLLISRFYHKFGLLRFVIFIVGIVLILHFIDNNYFKSFEINIYDDSLYTSLFVLVRIITVIMISQILTISTKPMDLNLGLDGLLKPLRLLHINTSIFTMMVSIALRFIPTLLNEANKILKAQASRGVDFNEGSFKNKITQIISLIVPMFVISYKRALDLADAMEARGYNPDKPRTSLTVLHMRGFDYFSLVSLNLILIGTIVAKIVFKL